jgi:S-formylglutathione hydrolase FrmB
VGYSILLPPGYESETRRYPVIYFLHGAGGNENGSAAAVAPGALQAMKAGTIPPIILVFPNGGVTTWYANSVDLSLPIETMIIDELIPHVDGAYRTIAAREGRAISGMSMGGFGALVLGLKHASLFSSIVAYAPALLDLLPNEDGEMVLTRAGGTHAGGHPIDPEQARRNALAYQKMFGGRPESFARHIPRVIVPREAATLRNMLPIRIVIGTADGLLNANELFHDLLIEHGYYHEYFVVNDVAHDLPTLLSRLGTDGFAFQARVGGWR